MHKIGDLGWRGRRTVVSARVTRRRRPRRAGFRRPIQRTVARLERRDRRASRRPGSAGATSSGGCRAAASRRVRQGQALRPAADPRQPGVPGAAGDDELLHAGRIVPVYRLTAGLTAARLRSAIRDALDRAGTATPSTCRRRSARTRARAGSRARSRRPTTRRRSRRATRPSAGSPSTSCWRSSSAWSGGAGSGSRAAPADRRRRRRATPTVRTALDGARWREVGRAVDADRRPGGRDGRDPRRPRPADADAPAAPGRRRLGQDGGRGLGAGRCRPGPACQGALLAPTDLLARQHLETLGALLDGARHRRDAADRLAQRRTARPRPSRRSRRARRRSSSGPTPCIQDAVAFADLGLVVIDEQHRFGVEQRGALEAKAGGRAPHVLLMTATPIPRTLGQVALRRPRRLRPADAAGGPDPDPDRASAGPTTSTGTWERVRDEAAPATGRSWSCR